MTARRPSPLDGFRCARQPTARPALAVVVARPGWRFASAAHGPYTNQTKALGSRGMRLLQAAQSATPFHIMGQFPSSGSSGRYPWLFLASLSAPLSQRNSYIRELWMILPKLALKWVKAA